MKKIIGLLLMLLALPMAFAKIEMYGDASGSLGEAVVGERGYVDTSNWNPIAEVFVCATRQGKVSNYGVTLQAEYQRSKALALLESVAKMDFSVFDHFGCQRLRVE